MRVHSNADGSVDGEFAVATHRGVSASALIRKLRDAFETQPGGLSRDYWLSVGQRYSIKEDDEVYRRYKGLNEIAMHYTHPTSQNIIGVFGASRDKMTPGAERKYRRKAESIFIRLHWNRDGSKPRR